MATNPIVKKIDDALGAHGKWKLRLKTAVTLGHSSISADDAACDKCCDFGKWLYGPEIDPVTKSGVPYSVVRRLHAEFHETAGRVVALATTRQQTEATRLIGGEFAQRSEKLARALTKWKGELSA